jgi:hypothetical protein
MASRSQTIFPDQRAPVQDIDDVDTSSFAALEPGLQSDDDDPTVAANPDEGGGFFLTFETACAQDTISRLRKIVMTIRNSQQRREAFTTWIENGNINGSFIHKNTSVIIEPMLLLRDVRTRWVSTHQMLRRCIEMQLVSLGNTPSGRLSYTIYFRPSIPSWHDQEVISGI